MSVKLYYKKSGEGPIPLIIIHGLFGSHKNWSSISKELSGLCTVYAVDMRNHGDSPNTDTHTLGDMSGDIELFCLDHSINKPVILGHSMGGLAAMAYALKHPERISGLIIEDIAPKFYRNGHENEFKSLHMDLSNFRNRKEVDEAMQKYVSDPMVRQFLQMSLDSTQSEGYKWKLNVGVLESSNFIEEFKYIKGTYPGKALFIAGGASNYVTEEDHIKIKEFFPEARIHTLKNADHWLHYSARDSFLIELKAFLTQIADSEST